MQIIIMWTTSRNLDSSLLFYSSLWLRLIFKKKHLAEIKKNPKSFLLTTASWPEPCVGGLCRVTPLHSSGHFRTTFAPRLTTLCLCLSELQREKRPIYIDSIYKKEYFGQTNHIFDVKVLFYCISKLARLSVINQR